MNICRSMLYIPGDSPGKIQHAPIFDADGILLDLEDAVALSEKDSARRMVGWFLRDYDFKNLVVTVRVNGADTKFFKDDLEEIIPEAPYAVRIPKCDGPKDVLLADRLITEIEERHGMAHGKVKIHAMIETAVGIENAFLMASASPRVKALTLGGQDLTADMGVRKTKEGAALFYARSRVSVAAHAAGIEAYDTIWGDINDKEGLFEETKRIIGLGFTGKAAISPDQCEIINSAFMPDEKELRKACRIVEAAEKAEKEGKGVIAVDGKMVDAPVVTRARHLVSLAEACGAERGASI